jgi:hypothetical protein
LRQSPGTRKNLQPAEIMDIGKKGRVGEDLKIISHAN